MWAPRVCDGTVSRAGASCEPAGLSVCGGADADAEPKCGGGCGDASRCQVGCPGGVAVGYPLLRPCRRDGSVGSAGSSESH